MPLSQQQQDAIRNALAQRNATQPCARCGHGNHSVIADGYISHSVSDAINPGNIVIGGPQIPTAVIACTNCGNLSFHATVALGL